METTIYYFLGLVTGAILTMMFVSHRLVKAISKQSEKSNEELEKVAQIMKAKILEKRSQIVSVQSRLAEVYGISQRQHELQAAADQPSKNALHSRHKNGIIGELKELEEKKHSVLKSILKDGFDPVISVLNEDGTKEEMKLSQFVARYDGIDPLKEGELPPAAPVTKPEEKDEIDEEIEKGRKAGKFVVYSGGKPDTTH
jgi:TPP-dependent 2-oxoacid decarboxylase